MSRLRKVKQAAADRIDGLAPEWMRLALRIHRHPEPALSEHKAVAWLADTLGRSGFDVERGVGGLRTAFVATRCGKSAEPAIAFLAEYDALPELGHACGHNLIGPAACLSAVALAGEAGARRVSIKVIGCPAEESYGGKVRLLERGVFNGLDAVLMAHGYHLTLGQRPAIGRASVICEFLGRAAHASSSPSDGANALDAVVQMFVGIGLLRQQIRTEARLHGIITHGGKAANIIPDYTRAEFYVRSADDAYLRELRTKVVACARAAAQATGTRLKLSSEGYTYRSIRPNNLLARAYEENMRLLGEEVDSRPPGDGMGSTDLGNVSHYVPALHGYFRITKRAIRPHSAAFAVATKSRSALRGMITAAKAMAMTALDLICTPSLLHEVRREFRERRIREDSDGG